MVADVGFRGTVQSMRRELLLDAAQQLIERTGWASVTMTKIADDVGVSRQTVYNEFGSKLQLADALALRELERFMAVVQDRFAANRDIIAGIHAACLGVLEMAESNLLVRTIVGTLPGEGDNEFLRLLTTDSGEIIAAASLVAKRGIIDTYPPTPLSDDELDISVDAIVRLILSAITRPAKAPRAVADDIAWIVSAVLAGAAARGV